MSMKHYLQVEIECDTRVKDYYGHFKCNKSFILSNKKDDEEFIPYTVDEIIEKDEEFIPYMVNEIYNFVKKFRKENNFVCNFSIDNLEIDREILVKRIFNNYKGSYTLVSWENCMKRNYNSYDEKDIKTSDFKKVIKLFVKEALEYIYSVEKE